MKEKEVRTAILFLVVVGLFFVFGFQWHWLHTLLAAFTVFSVGLFPLWIVLEESRGIDGETDVRHRGVQVHSKNGSGSCLAQSTKTSEE